MRGVAPDRQIKRHIAIDGPSGGGDINRDLRMNLVERRQFRHQPVHGERRQAVHHQPLPTGARFQRAFRGIQFAYHPRCGAGKILAGLRQPHGFVSAIKQRDPQLCFETANMAADRAGGEKQLIRSGAEAAETGGGFESGQVRQGVDFFIG